MKDAKRYEQKLKKLLRGLKKAAAPAAPANPEELLTRIIEAILAADAPEGEASRAMAAVQKEFVDYNELRVAPERDILDCLGDEQPLTRAKVAVLQKTLNNLFDRSNCYRLEYLTEMSRRDLRRHLRELGMSAFAEAYLAMTCFGVHAIPVDETLREVLQMTDHIPPEAELADVQAFLEKLIPPKDGYAAHVFFRQYVAQHAKALEKKRKADAQRRAAEEEAKRLAEEEARRRQAEEEARKARQEAEKKAEKEKKTPETPSKGGAKKTAASRTKSNGSQSAKKKSPSKSPDRPRKK